MDHTDFTNIYRTFHPTDPEHTFFSPMHGNGSRIGHMIAQKTSLNKFKRFEIILCVFSDNQGMKLETSQSGNSSKYM